MSANGKLDESPNHFIVLDAISRGISNVDKISKASKLDKVEVELIANDLLTQRLTVKTERKGLIFRKKKLEFGITDIGMKLLNTKKNWSKKSSRCSDHIIMEMGHSYKAIWMLIECGCL